MTFVIKDFFDSTRKILFVTISGITSIEDLNQWITSITPDKAPEKYLKMITDARGAIYNFKAEDSKAIDKPLEELCRKYTWIKAAVIHKNPKETALSMVLRNRLEIKNYSQVIFSTMEAAENWIMNY